MRLNIIDNKTYLISEQKEIKKKKNTRMTLAVFIT